VADVHGLQHVEGLVADDDDFRAGVAHRRQLTEPAKRIVDAGDIDDQQPRGAALGQLRDRRFDGPRDERDLLEAGRAKQARKTDSDSRSARKASADVCGLAAETGSFRRAMLLMRALAAVGRCSGWCAAMNR
jgi:hypothetical protein